MKKRPCVLLIDDDSTSSFLKERLLARLDVTDCVLVAESGQQALILLLAVRGVPLGVCQ